MAAIVVKLTYCTYLHINKLHTYAALLYFQE